MRINSSDFTGETRECQEVDSSFSRCSQLTSVSGSQGGQQERVGEQRQLGQCMPNNQQCEQAHQILVYHVAVVLHSVVDWKEIHKF